MQSLAETTGPLSVHSTTCNRGGLGISRARAGGGGGGGTGQKTEHCQNVFRTPRQSLLRDQIFSSISKGFYLSPSGEIIRLMSSRVVLPGDLQSCHGPYWNFFLLGFLLFCLYFEGRGPPWVESPEEEAMIHWIHLGKHKHTPFPVRLVSQISIVLLTRLGTKWAEEEKYPSISRNAFLLLLRYLPVVC